MRTTHHDRQQIRQSADPFSQNRPFSAIFVQWVCTLAATPPEVAVAPPPTGGNDAIQASDTPATRRQRASHGAKPPSPPVWRAPSCFQDRHSAGWRENTRPARPLQRLFREKTRPASTKTPNLGCFKRAGRTFSRPNETTTAFAHSFTGTHETSNTFARPQCRKNTHFGRAKVMAVSPTHEDRAAKVSPVSSRRSSALDTAPMHQIAHHCTGN